MQWWLDVGEGIGPTDKIISKNNQAHAQLSDDGNFCVFHQNTQLWCTNSSTGAHTGSYNAQLQVR